MTKFEQELRRMFDHDAVFQKQNLQGMPAMEGLRTRFV